MRETKINIGPHKTALKPMNGISHWSAYSPPTPVRWCYQDDAFKGHEGQHLSQTRVTLGLRLKVNLPSLGILHRSSTSAAPKKNLWG